VVGDVVLEEGRTDAHRHPRLRGTVLYGDRHAGKRPWILRRDPLGLCERPIGVHEAEGVDSALAFFEPAK
jgi:hypothetical protein